MKKLIIAIDGPVGSGKSTIAKILANKLNYVYVDTGAMYRALTLKVINQNIDFQDVQKIIELANNTDIKLIQNNNKLFVYTDDNDVSESIRTPEVSRKTPLICDIPEVRSRLVDLQKKMGEEGGIVMEGRDITTVVFPNADKKFYLSASIDERANRRFNELKEKGFNISLDEIKADVAKRDEQDKGRKHGALKIHPDAIIVDTTGKSIDEIVNQMLSLIKI